MDRVEPLVSCELVSAGRDRAAFGQNAAAPRQPDRRRALKVTGPPRRAADLPLTVRRGVVAVPGLGAFHRYMPGERHAVIDPILQRDKGPGRPSVRIERPEADEFA